MGKQLSIEIIGNTNSVIDYLEEPITDFKIITMRFICLYFRQNFENYSGNIWEDTSEIYETFKSTFSIDEAYAKAILRNLLAMNHITAVIKTEHLEFFKPKIKDDSVEDMFAKLLDYIVGFRYNPKTGNKYRSVISDSRFVDVTIKYRNNHYNRMKDNSIRYYIY